MTDPAMNPRVYVETTIPSFYHEVRTEPEMQARRAWTREWWDDHRWGFELVTSEAVIDELENGEFPQKADALALIEALPLLDVNEAIADIVDIDINRHVMPADPAGDALHLALASYYRCDFLVTWNCRHLANANKFSHIRRVNGLLGLFVPSLVTPLELLGEAEP
jgi:predicted nucleic acid-binding protein